MWSKCRFSRCVCPLWVWTGWPYFKKYTVTQWCFIWYSGTIYLMAAPVLLAITHREPPTVHHDGMSLKKIIWKIKAKTTSMVFINATGPALLSEGLLPETSDLLNQTSQLVWEIACPTHSVEDAILLKLKGQWHTRWGQRLHNTKCSL